MNTYKPSTAFPSPRPGCRLSLAYAGNFRLMNWFCLIKDNGDVRRSTAAYRYADGTPCTTAGITWRLLHV